MSSALSGCYRESQAVIILQSLRPTLPICLTVPCSSDSENDRTHCGVWSTSALMLDPSDGSSRHSRSSSIVANAQCGHTSCTALLCVSTVDTLAVALLSLRSRYMRLLLSLLTLIQSFTNCMAILSLRTQSSPLVRGYCQHVSFYKTKRFHFSSGEDKGTGAFFVVHAV